MSYAQFHTGFQHHPKIAKAGRDVAWLWAACIGHAHQFKTEGFVPLEALPALGLCSKRQAAALVRKGIEVRLFEPTEGGIRVHDYLEWNLSNSEIFEKKKSQNLRQTRHRSRVKPSTYKKRHALVTPPNTTHNSEESSNEDSLSPNPSHGEGQSVSECLPEEPQPQPAESERVNGADACTQLRTCCNDTVGCSFTTPQAVRFGEVLTSLQSQHGRADLIALLGAFAAAGGFAWREQGRPTIRYLLEKDGGNLADAIDQALAWERSGKPKIQPRPPLRVVSSNGRGQLADPNDRYRYADGSRVS